MRNAEQYGTQNYKLYIMARVPQKHKVLIFYVLLVVNVFFMGNMQGVWYLMNRDMDETIIIISTILQHNRITPH